MLCTHKTTIFCQFGNSEICPNFANPYLTQFSSISGGNCINKAEDDANKNRVEAKNVLENYCHSLKSSISSDEVKNKIPADDKKALEDAIDETIKWLDSNPAAEKEEYEEKRKALEGVAMPILQKMAVAGGVPGAGMPGGPMPDVGAAAGGAPPGADPAGGLTIEEID